MNPNREPADRLPFQLVILFLVLLACWAIFTTPTVTVKSKPVPVIQIPK